MKLEEDSCWHYFSYSQRLQFHWSFSWVVTAAPIIIAVFRAGRRSGGRRASVFLLLLVSKSFPRNLPNRFYLGLIDQNWSHSHLDARHTRKTEHRVIATLGLDQISSNFPDDDLGHWMEGKGLLKMYRLLGLIPRNCDLLGLWWEAKIRHFILFLLFFKQILQVIFITSKV